ncbi:MAG TPA: hypothetical protein PLH94_05175 [Fimbriimonadaceae bacterium]|nr:hypothetical protein [Fimbriimonadaceae bacterium]
MNKSTKYSFAVITAVAVVSLGTVVSKPGQAQIAQGLVILQPNTPGFAQNGNINVSGTARASQFVGGGAGLTNLSWANVTGAPAFLTGIPSPLVVNSSATTGDAIVTGKNSALTGAIPGVGGFTESVSGSGVFGIANSSTGASSGVKGRSESTSGFGGFFLGSATSGLNYGVYGQTNSASGYAGYFTGGKGLYASVLEVGSTALVTNLNADWLDGQDGAYYTNAQNLTGTINDARLSNNVALLDAIQTFTAANTFDAAVTVNARTTTSNFTMTNGAAANTVMLGNATGVASWGTVGNARLTSDAASLSKVTGGAFSINAGDINGADQSKISLFTGATEKIKLVPNAAGAAGLINTYGPNGNLNTRLTFLNGSPDNGYLAACDSAGALQAQLFVDAAGNGIVSADTKNFVVPDPTDPRYNIVYACVEGPEAAMYTRGTGRLVNGQAVIDLPDHYLKLANLATATIQVTPLDDCRGLFVKKTNGMIIVKELGGGKANVEFDWRIEAVRKGHEDYQAVRPWNDALPAGDEQQQWNARLQSIAAKRARANRSNRP